MAEPKRVTSSPICSPESEAGLPDTTVFTLANGVFAAAGVGCDVEERIGTDVDEDVAGTGSVAISANRL